MLDFPPQSEKNLLRLFCSHFSFLLPSLATGKAGGGGGGILRSNLRARHLERWKGRYLLCSTFTGSQEKVFFLHTNLFFAPNILPLFFGCSKSNSSSNGFSRLCDRVIQRSSSSSQQLKMGEGRRRKMGWVNCHPTTILFQKCNALFLNTPPQAFSLLQRNITFFHHFTRESVALLFLK